MVVRAQPYHWLYLQLIVSFAEHLLTTICVPRMEEPDCFTFLIHLRLVLLSCLLVLLLNCQDCSSSILPIYTYTVIRIDQN